MLIDLFTVIAQIINFLILVWLLKRFLYKPILKAIDAREKKVADKMADAENIKKEATKMREQFRALNKEIEEHHDEKIKEAEEEAKRWREQIIKETNEDIDELKQKQLISLKKETKKLKQFIQKQTGNELFSMLKKAFYDLSNTSLEKQIVTIFIGRLKQTDIKKTWHDLIKKTTLDKATVQTAFQLSLEEQKRIHEAIDDLFDQKLDVQFTVDSKLIGGIKLTVENQEISWNIDRYIESLESKVNEQLENE